MPERPSARGGKARLMQRALWSLIVLVLGVFYLSSRSAQQHSWGGAAPLSLGRPQAVTQPVAEAVQAASSAASSRATMVRQLISEDKKIEWLHLPKTGTSFGNTIIPWACGELLPGDFLYNGFTDLRKNFPRECLARFRTSWRRKRAIGDHQALVGRTDEELTRVFTMVRSPRERLASGYHHVHGYHRLNASEGEICAFARGTRIAQVALGGQARMVVGHALHTEVPPPPQKGQWHMFETAEPPTPELAEAACARLRAFAFVGVTEYWDASVCLFHALWGGETDPKELKNVRRGKYADQPDSVKRVDCGDVGDDRLFQCAVELFLERLAAHPQCAEGVDAAEARARAGLPPLPS